MNCLDQIRIVLVRPLFGGNMGSVCRSMKNMGLSDLVVVKPHEDLDYYEAHKMAMYGQDLLEARKQFDTLAEAVGDCVRVAGTTARPGLYRSHAKTMREWAPSLLEQTVEGKVAIVFGPENHGLANEEVALCTHIIKIPCSKQYESLNLAQAVMVCCYELFVAADQFVPPKEVYGEASIELRERMLKMWRETLTQIGFFDVRKAEHMMMAVRRIFTRGSLSFSDVNILMGIARQAQWAAGAKNAKRELLDSNPE